MNDAGKRRCERRVGNDDIVRGDKNCGIDGDLWNGDTAAISGREQRGGHGSFDGECAPRSIRGGILLASMIASARREIDAAAGGADSFITHRPGLEDAGQGSSMAAMQRHRVEHRRDESQSNEERYGSARFQNAPKLQSRFAKCNLDAQSIEYSSRRRKAISRMQSWPRDRILGAFKVIENTPILFTVQRSRIHRALLTRLLLVLLLLLARGVCPGAETACCSEQRLEAACADDGCCAAEHGECEERSAHADHHPSAQDGDESRAKDGAGASLPCSQGCAWCMTFTQATGSPIITPMPLFPTSFAALPIPSVTGAHGIGIDHPPC